MHEKARSLTTTIIGLSILCLILTMWLGPLFLGGAIAFGVSAGMASNTFSDPLEDINAEDD